jgi:hypothetical protein
MINGIKSMNKYIFNTFIVKDESFSQGIIFRFHAFTIAAERTNMVCDGHDPFVTNQKGDEP